MTSEQTGSTRSTKPERRPKQAPRNLQLRTNNQQPVYEDVSQLLQRSYHEEEVKTNTTSVPPGRFRAQSDDPELTCRIG